MAKESKIKPGTRRKIEGRDHVWSGSKWVESMGFWTKDKTKTVKTKGGRQDYRLVDGKWVKSYGKKPGAGDSSKTKSTDSSKTKSTNTNKKRNALSIFSPKVWSNTKRNIAAVENPSGKDSSKTTSKSKNRNKLNFGKAVKAGESMKKGDTTKSTPKSTSGLVTIYPFVRNRLATLFSPIIPCTIVPTFKLVDALYLCFFMINSRKVCLATKSIVFKAI